MPPVSLVLPKIPPSFNHFLLPSPGLDCRIPLNLCGKPWGWGRILSISQKIYLSLPPEKSPLIKLPPPLSKVSFPPQSNRKFEVITKFLYSLLLRFINFLTSSFMYTYILLISINQCALNCITKAFNGQNSSNQNFQLPSCYLDNPGSINAFHPLFSILFFISNFTKFLLNPLQL